MDAPDMKVDLNSGGFGPAESQELAERLYAKTNLRVASDVFDYCDLTHHRFVRQVLTGPTWLLAIVPRLRRVL